MMDTNSNIMDSHINTFITNTALYDVIDYHLLELIQKHTYLYLREIIYFILVSEDILHTIEGM